ncbi:hypothetical protein D3C75_465210 [compost metagenome]
MVIRSFTHDQIKITFTHGSLANVETVVTYNLYEMPICVAQQMGSPTVEDVRTWLSWLEARLDKGGNFDHIVSLCNKFIQVNSEE